MPTVISVKFKYAARDLWFDPADSGAQEGDHVICLTERGQEIGLCTMDAVEMDEERLRANIGEAQLKPVDRIASEEDLRHAEKLAEKSERALPVFRRLVHESDLDMKPVGVEYLFGGSKVICYFSAEERVDFRQLVRDLSRELHERIDMRQIGVREEAAIVGGFAHCGQELCCARFGHQFEPVSIRMAKEQDLPLNSAKISGACGRLMCCLRYEFDAYRDFKGRAPKRNAVIETPLGKAKIVEYDTPKEQICLRLENGKQIRIPLADMEASEAACKKSEELGCACRPDTVTRAALDKLQSPDVQMALAELDRKMGVVAEDTFSPSDIFVETKPRRRRNRGGDAAQADAQDGAEQPAKQPRNKNKARRADKQTADANAAANGASGNAANASAGEKSSGGGMRPRRRRKKVVTAEGTPSQAQGQAPQQGQQSSQPQAAGQKPGARRRRHHSAAAGDVTPAKSAAPAKNNAPAKGSAPKGAPAKGNGPAKPAAPAKSAPAKHRRRPGDRGGIAAQQAAAGNASQDKPKAPKHQARPSRPQTQQPQADASGEAKAKRRRRHRGGRGKGGAAGEGGSGASVE